MNFESKVDTSKVITKIPQVGCYRVLFKIHPFGKAPDYSTLSYSAFKDTGKACYSSLFTAYKSEALPKNSDWLTSVYMAEIKTGADGTKFSEKHIERWVELCTKYKLLPKSPLFNYSMERTSVKKLGKNVDHIKLVSTIYIDGVFQPTAYMWLDSFRHLCEDQGFVMAALYLHDELGIDFYVSYVISSYLNISNTGHHSLKISKSGLYDSCPTKAPDIKKFNGDEVIDLKLASVLYRACENYYDLAKSNNISENFLTFIKRTGDKVACSWFCNGMHSKACKNEKDLIVQLKNIFHKNIGKIVRAETEEERKSLLKMIK